MVGAKGLKIPTEILSVAGLTAYIQALIEEDEYLCQGWVTGEVSSVSDRGGHLFFTLQEPNGSAVIGGVVWRSHRAQLVTEPTVGEQIFVLGQVRVYAPQGKYQLYAVQVLPAGEGLQALRRRQIQARLTAEGLFDPALKRPLPPYPQTVAVVTSPQAAAWGDIQRTLGLRYPGLRVLLSPAIVQGTQAPTSIAAALDRVGRDGRAELVLLARGGGAREDLTCFDDERVVRAIVHCPIPVVTGIGHQQDETLADLAADVATHTPTAAAEALVPALAMVMSQHYSRGGRLKGALQSAVQMHYERVADARRRLEQLRLDQQVYQAQQQIQWFQQRLRQTTQYRLQSAQQQCAHLRQTLDNLDPEAVLRRGYALVRQGQRLITEAETLTLGSEIQIQLAQGALLARVIDTQNVHELQN